MNNINLQATAAKLFAGALYYQFAPASLHKEALVAQVSALAMSTIATAALRRSQDATVIWKIEAILPFVVISVYTFFQEISWRVYLLSIAILGGVQVLIDYTIRVYHRGDLLSFIPSGLRGSTESLWRNASDGSVLLNRHPPLRFDDKWVLTEDGKGGLQGQLKGSANPKFSLTQNIVFLHEGNVPSIQFDCPTLQPLIKSGALAITDLHTSAKGRVNLSDEMRENFHLPASAYFSCLCYPAQLDPKRAEATSREIQSNKDIPSFMAGLLLYGGFAFFDEFDKLVAVKAFTDCETTAETLSTKKTVSGNLLPDQLRHDFEEGTKMTSGTDDWAIYGGGIASTIANKVTAPKLREHLSHYTYLSPDQYALSSLSEVAPYGAFVYRLKSGAFQVVPIGKNEKVTSSKSELNLSEANAGNLRLTLKLILENSRPFYQVFRSNLKKFFSHSYLGLEFEGKSYSAKQNQIFIRARGFSHAITLDENGKITAAKKIVKGGMFSSDREETFNADQIPAELVQDLETFYMRLMSHCYATQTRGLNEALFFITKEGPESAPLNYLRLLADALNRRKTLRTRIFDLVQGKFIGEDAKGLTRTFITHLVKGLIHTPYFYDRDEKGFYPFQKGSLSTSDRAFFDQLGTLLAFCQKSDGSYVTGHFFHDTFFSSLQAFTVKELASKDLPSLSVERKVALYQALIGKQPAYDKLFEILDSNDISSVEDILLDVYLETYLPEPTPKSQDVKENWSTRWRQILLQGFIKEIEKKGQYSLGALHAIGHALYQRGTSVHALNLSDKIQGVVDPKIVAGSIKYNGGNQNVQVKVAWLKEWIQSTSLENVKQFLEFVSGTRGLPPSQKITVNESESTSPHLKTATCFWNIYMPYGRVDEVGHHATRDKFIQRVIESIQNSAYQKG